jgi:hypothetical protein
MYINSVSVGLVPEKMAIPAGEKNWHACFDNDSPQHGDASDTTKPF